MLRSLLLVGLSLPLLAAETKPANPLLGKWRSGSDCKIPTYVFTDKLITHTTEEDGEPVTNNFRKFRYTVSGSQVSGSQVTVDFNEPHDMEGLESKTKAVFKIVKPDHIQLVRTDRSKPTDLIRCP